MHYDNQRDLSPSWCVWLPLVPAAVLAVLAIAWRDGFFALTYKEGPIEWATVAVGLCGAVAALVAFVRLRGSRPLLRAWMLIFAAGLIFLAGEESSWGQHLLNPRLPGDPEEVKNDGVANVDPRDPNAVTGEEREEALAQLGWFRRINDQGETNLHNLPGFWGDLFGKLPKQAVEYGSLIACVIIPTFFARRLRLDDPTLLRHWLMPTSATTVAALIAFLLPWPRRVTELLHEDAPIVLRLSEPQEFYLGLTLALYAGSLAVRLSPQHAAAASPAAVPSPS